MLIKYAILGLLHYRDMYGYQIKNHIAKHFSAMWTVNFGQIYSSLKDLAADGQIVLSEVVASSTGAPSKKLYSLTDKGREEFKNWLKSSLNDKEIHRNPFDLRFVFLGFGEEEDALKLIEAEIQVQEKAFVQRKKNIPLRKSQGFYVAKVSELGIRRNELTLEWLYEVRDLILKAISDREGSAEKGAAG